MKPTTYLNATNDPDTFECANGRIIAKRVKPRTFEIFVDDSKVFTTHRGLSGANRSAAFWLNRLMLISRG